MKKKVLVTGVTGQDGPNMVDYLLKETDYLVYGMTRRSSNINLSKMSYCWAIYKPIFIKCH